ncbi:MAG: hypothetical protein U9N77_02750, partial [Thermodesulfobacteriota bacterium]|nr:hypothetical protein [Thermodesulfobacteriota bacterium]
LKVNKVSCPGYFFYFFYFLTLSSEFDKKNLVQGFLPSFPSSCPTTQGAGHCKRLQTFLGT